MAIERNIAGLRRVGDEGADTRLHLRQSVADAAERVPLSAPNFALADYRDRHREK
ncbi:MAG TPA: hypothetical protein VFR00_01165 [Hyphomicrobiaceae bacterium]|jgi:hypothetical protein|nr:hypothetical protein [Hyphomicrobiaceae bacterium]